MSSADGESHNDLLRFSSFQALNSVLYYTQILKLLVSGGWVTHSGWLLKWRPGENLHEVTDSWLGLWLGYKTPLLLRAQSSSYRLQTKEAQVTKNSCSALFLKRTWIKTTLIFVKSSGRKALHQPNTSRIEMISHGYLKNFNQAVVWPNTSSITKNAEVRQ